MDNAHEDASSDGAEDAAFTAALRSALTLAATAETVAAPDSPDLLLDRLVRRRGRGGPLARGGA